MINLGVCHNWRPVYNLPILSSVLRSGYQFFEQYERSRLQPSCSPQLSVKSDTIRRKLRCSGAEGVQFWPFLGLLTGIPQKPGVFSGSSSVWSLATSFDHRSWGWSLWMWCFEGRLGPQPSGTVSRSSFLSISGMALGLRQHVKPDLPAEQHLAALLCQPSPEFRVTAGRLGARLCPDIRRKPLLFYFRFCLYLLRAAASGYCPPPLSSRKMWKKNCDCHSKGD